MNLIEHYFNCSYCGETISMLLDLSIDEQRYIEDCEVCCAPIEISYSARNSELIDFMAGCS
jgi:transcription elongation factor Elf1